MLDNKNISYSNSVKPFSSGFALIKLTDSEIDRIESFARHVIMAKSKEGQYRRDNSSMLKRFYTGTAGELAVEKYLNIKGIVDWSIGDSDKYYHPDLSSIGIKAGVKTVDYGLFPIVFKDSKSHELINILFNKRYVYICGVATPSVLNKYQSVDLIRDPKLRNKGTKSAFYGFEHLLHFKDIDELKELIK